MTRMRPLTKNNPIAKVIKNFADKKSGKVTEARKEIQRRFYGLDWKDQKKILTVFLESCISDRAWAYSMLLNMWDATFESIVRNLWDKYHEEKCAWVIIRHFPKDFIKQHIDEFQGERDYYFVCRRLIEEPNFIIDRERLSNIDYLMAMYHGNRHVDDEEALNILFQIVHEVCVHQYPFLEVSRSYIMRRNDTMHVAAFEKISMALYYLEKMHKDEVVCSFRVWESGVQTTIKASKELEEIKGLSLSDYDYKDKMAEILQKYLFEALPRRYKKAMK